jgi:hypothetical protein
VVVVSVLSMWEEEVRPIVLDGVLMVFFVPVDVVGGVAAVVLVVSVGGGGCGEDLVDGGGGGDSGSMVLYCSCRASWSRGNKGLIFGESYTKPVAVGGACVAQPTSHLGAMRQPPMRPTGSPSVNARMQWIG